jgi:hypothetical protein
MRALELMREGRVTLMLALAAGAGDQKELRDAITILNCAIRLEEKTRDPSPAPARPAGVQRRD